MDEALHRILVRGHETVIGHCRFLLASPNLQNADRATLEARLAVEEKALSDLTVTSRDNHGYFPSPFQTDAA